MFVTFVTFVIFLWMLDGRRCLKVSQPHKKPPFRQAFEADGKLRCFHTFFMPKKNCPSQDEIQNPRNPSLLPQNRFKSLRRIFAPPRQKLALYGALK